jgi:tetratricopeptide (TPR) repeat protein
MMKRNLLCLPLALAAGCALSLAAVSASAQTATIGSGKIHGQITNADGAPVAAGTVSLYPTQGGVSPNVDPKYVLNVGADGSYQGDNVASGSYSIIFRTPGMAKDKVVDQIDNVQITPGADTAANFDMTRPAYLAKLSPEQRKEIEEAQKKNASILKENAQIKNLNADLGKARADDHNKDYADAATLMQKDATLKPDAAVLWIELGLAQAGLGEQDKADSSKAQQAQQELTDAETNLQKGVTMDQAAKKPDAAMEGAADDKLGEVLATDGKIPDALAAYDAAAKANPTGAGMYYENESIMMDRMAATSPAAADAIVPAADKAIAADPNRPIPYYLKGRALVAKATVDPKTQKIVAPPGCVEAYQKYLQLAPTGQFAAEVKGILDSMNQTQETSYKASKKH